MGKKPRMTEMEKLEWVISQFGGITNEVFEAMDSLFSKKDKKYLDFLPVYIREKMRKKHLKALQAIVDFQFEIENSQEWFDNEIQKYD